MRLIFALLIAALYLAACSNTEKKADAEPSPRAPQQRVTAPQPQTTPPAERARLHTDLAAGYYERGQMDVALDELNIAVGLDPNYAPAYNIYGLVYSVLGDASKAEQNFSRALLLAPNDSDIHHNWGWYLCQHKREREALDTIRDRGAQSALQDAGDCARQRRPVRHHDRRHAAGRGLFPQGAARATRERARPATASHSSPTRKRVIRTGATGSRA